MEWIQARALKSSFVSEIGMISTQQVFIDDFRSIANVTCDDFSVDDLLDFSDKDFENCSFQESEEDEGKDCFSTCSQQGSFDMPSNSIDNNQFGELVVPVDDMENLEWLSQFVDDSGRDISLLYPVGNSREKTGTGGFVENVTRPAVHTSLEPCFPLPLSRKPRSKRSRPTSKLFWPIGSSSVITELSLSSSSTNSPFVFAEPVQEIDTLFSVERPAVKKLKLGSGQTGSQPPLRRCSHCHVQKTPQWRAGPMGPKTLCNACGVRYKSGRLFPEYRPACSPTFSQEIHSNSHRKVLEMRRQKEETGLPHPNLTPLVPFVG